MNFTLSDINWDTVLFVLAFPITIAAGFVAGRMIGLALQGIL